MSLGPTPAELSAAIALYERALPAGRRYAFDIGPLDTLGMTVMIEAFTSSLSGAVDGFGYGASADEARVGGLGELSETLHILAHLSNDEGLTSSYETLVRREGADRVVDPLTLCLPAGSAYVPDRPMSWVKVKRWPAGEAFVPREFVAISSGSYRGTVQRPDPLVTPITNGLGAGRSMEQALAHGLLELFQRDGNCVTFRAMDQGTVIDLADVPDSGVGLLIERLRAHGIVPLAKLASTEFGLTNLYVVDGGNSDPPFALQVTACGEAAHPNATRALRKALLEFMAARCRKAMMHGPLEAVSMLAPQGYMATTLAAADPDKEEPRALSAMAHWIGLSSSALRDLLASTVLAETKVVSFADLPSVADGTVADPADRLADLTARLHAADMPIYYYDASVPGGPAVVKAIVPGLECETMSYHRIGERGVARLMALDPACAGVGKPPAGASPVRLTPEATERLGGPAWLNGARIDAIVGRLYPLYREPASHTVQLMLGRRVPA